ncbi:MAG: metallophosphoesterase [Christensenellales bacterium]
MTWIKKLLLAMVVCILCIYIITAIVQTGSFELVEMDFTSDRLSDQLNGYRIAFVTDPHLEANAGNAQLKKVIECLNHENVDLLLLGGDYGADYRVCLALLSEVKTKDGIYAVMGNHDVGHAADILRAASESGIIFLNNDGFRIKNNLYIAGVEDLLKGVPDISKAIGKANGNDFVLLLSHNPDMMGEVAGKSIDLVLSGHTHGGQITFFGLFAPITASRYGYRSGLYEAEGKPALLVSGGLGTIYINVRAFAIPQVHILTLKVK